MGKLSQFLFKLVRNGINWSETVVGANPTYMNAVGQFSLRIVDLGFDFPSSCAAKCWTVAAEAGFCCKQRRILQILRKISATFLQNGEPYGVHDKTAFAIISRGPLGCENYPQCFFGWKFRIYQYTRHYWLHDRISTGFLEKLLEAPG